MYVRNSHVNRRRRYFWCCSPGCRHTYYTYVTCFTYVKIPHLNQRRRFFVLQFLLLQFLPLREDTCTKEVGENGFPFATRLYSERWSNSDTFSCLRTHIIYVLYVLYYSYVRTCPQVNRSRHFRTRGWFRCFASASINQPNNRLLG